VVAVVGDVLLESELEQAESKSSKEQESKGSAVRMMIRLPEVRIRRRIEKGSERPSRFAD
jgi:hypothetical protein